MKKAIFAMFTASVFMFSCTEKEQFNVNYTADVYIADSIGSFYDFDVVDTIDSRFIEITGDHYVDPDKVEKVVFQKLSMTITDTGSSEVFSDLRDIEVFVSGIDTINTEEQEVKVAYSYFNGADAKKELVFKVNPQNVIEAFRNEKIVLIVRTRKRNIYLGDFPIHIAFSVMYEAAK